MKQSPWGSTLGPWPRALPLPLPLGPLSSPPGPELSLFPSPRPRNLPLPLPQGNTGAQPGTEEPPAPSTRAQGLVHQDGPGALQPASSCLRGKPQTQPGPRDGSTAGAKPLSPPSPWGLGEPPSTCAQPERRSHLCCWQRPTCPPQAPRATQAPAGQGMWGLLWWAGAREPREGEAHGSALGGGRGFPASHRSTDVSDQDVGHCRPFSWPCPPALPQGHAGQQARRRFPGASLQHHVLFALWVRSEQVMAWCTQRPPTAGPWA